MSTWYDLYKKGPQKKRIKLNDNPERAVNRRLSLHHINFSLFSFSLGSLIDNFVAINTCVK